MLLVALCLSTILDLALANEHFGYPSRSAKNQRRKESDSAVRANAREKHRESVNVPMEHVNWYK